MPTTPEPAPAPGTARPAPARSAATVNEEIRALWLCAGGRLSTEQRRRYERLVAEWSAAVHAEAETPAPRDSRSGHQAGAA